MEDSACLICSDDAKQEGAINERIIPTFLNPNENESKHLFFSVLNLALNLVISPTEFSGGLSTNEHLHKTSSLHLPSTFCELPAASHCQSSQLPVAKKSSMKHES